MSLRRFIANKVPLVFEWLRKHKLYPMPEDLKRTRWLGKPGLPNGVEETVCGTFRPSSDALVMETLDDPVSLRHREHYNNWLADYGKEWKFGFYKIPNVKIMPDYGIHATAEATYIDTYCSKYSLYNPKAELYTAALRFLPAKVQHGPAIFMGMNWYNNYYHWLIDILPRLQNLEKPLADGLPVAIPAVMGANAKQCLRRALDKLGHQATEIYEMPGVVHQFEHLIMPTNMTFALDVSQAQVDFLRSVFLPEGESGKPRRRIYISRKDAAMRRILNEDEVFAALKPHGFESVTLSGLSMDEQVDLFSHADFIIGPHGAGFSNLVFSRPGATVLEILQDGHYTPCFAKIAQLAKLKHGFMVGVRSGEDKVVEIDKLEQLLSRMI